MCIFAKSQASFYDVMHTSWLNLSSIKALLTFWQNSQHFYTVKLKRQKL